MPNRFLKNITVCIITRDQGEILRGCLERLKVYPWEILVLDTGSKDESVKIAREYTEHVEEFTWVDDFAAAKNYAAKLAPTDYILSVDTDEYLKEADVSLLKKVIDNNPKSVGCIKLESAFSIGGDKRLSTDLLPRFYDRRYFRFEGRIHEQIVSHTGGEAPRFSLPLLFLHEGYDLYGKEREAKAKRNIGLLKKELERCLDGIEPKDYLSLSRNKQEEIAYFYYQLGKSYYFLGDYQNAKDAFKSCFGFDLDEKKSFVSDLMTSYGYACLNTNDLEGAGVLFSVYEEFKSNADFLFVIGLISMQLGEFERAVCEFLNATEIPDCTVRGANSFLAFYNAGVVCQCLGDSKNAKKYYKNCGDYEPAKQRLKELQ